MVRPSGTISIKVSGADALWTSEAMVAGTGYHRSAGRHLEAKLGCGLPVGTRFVGTPRVGVRTSKYGRDYRIGYGVNVLEQGRLNFQLGVDAERLPDTAKGHLKAACRTGQSVR